MLTFWTKDFSYELSSFYEGYEEHHGPFAISFEQLLNNKYWERGID